MLINRHEETSLIPTIAPNNTVVNTTTTESDPTVISGNMLLTITYKLNMKSYICTIL